MESKGSIGRYAVRVVIRRVIYLAIAGIIAAILGAFIVPGAHASPAPGQVRAQSPGVAYRWGAPAAWFETNACGSDSTAFQAWLQTKKGAPDGGWQFGGGANITVGAGTASNNSSAVRTPSYRVLFEPVIPTCAGAGANANRWTVLSEYGAMNDPRSGSQVARTLLSYNNTDRAWVCQDTEWALPSAQFKYNGSAGGDFAPNQNSRSVVALYGPTKVTPATPQNSRCPYLAYVTLNVTTYTGPNSTDISGNPNPGVTVNTGVIWAAETWYGATTTNYYAPADPQQQICRVGGVAVSDQCPFVLGTSGGVDGTDPAQVCGNAPTPIWLDLGWLNKWIFYMAQCLFRPANGFDRGQWVTNTWEAGPAGDIQASLQRAGGAFVIGEECGMVLNTGGTGPIPGFTIDTCGWNQFSFLKVIIAGASTMLFAWWLFFFIVQCIVGVLNRHSPNPVEDGSK